MPRTVLRRVAPWVLLALVGVGAGVGAATTVDAPSPVVGAAVRVVAVELPEARALPPGAVERVVEAVTERPEPLRKSLDLVVATGAVLLALGALVNARRVGALARAVGSRHGPGATRAPPVTG